MDDAIKNKTNKNIEFDVLVNMQENTVSNFFVLVVRKEIFFTSLKGLFGVPVWRVCLIWDCSLLSLD